MKEYVAQLILEGQLSEYTFKTAGNPVEHLWEKFGMSTHIETLTETDTETETEDE